MWDDDDDDDDLPDTFFLFQDLSKINHIAFSCHITLYFNKNLKKKKIYLYNHSHFGYSDTTFKHIP